MPRAWCLLPSPATLLHNFCKTFLYFTSCASIIMTPSALLWVPAASLQEHLFSSSLLSMQFFLAFAWNEIFISPVVICATGQQFTSRCHKEINMSILILQAVFLHEDYIFAYWSKPGPVLVEHSDCRMHGKWHPKFCFKVSGPHRRAAVMREGNWSFFGDHTGFQNLVCPSKLEDGALCCSKKWLAGRVSCPGKKVKRQSKDL